MIYLRINACRSIFNPNAKGLTASVSSVLNSIQYSSYDILFIPQRKNMVIPSWSHVYGDGTNKMWACNGDMRG